MPPVALDFHDTWEGGPMEVDWVLLVERQLAQPLDQFKWEKLEDGDCLALLDRNSFALDFDRRVFVVLGCSAEESVLVFTEDGRRLHEPDDFVVDGVQSRSEGEHSFKAEYGDGVGGQYYRLPLMAHIFSDIFQDAHEAAPEAEIEPETEPLPAPTTPAPAAAAVPFEPTPTPESDLAPAPAQLPAAFDGRFQRGARVMLPPPHPENSKCSAATLLARIAPSPPKTVLGLAFVVWDEKQFCKFDVSNSFLSDLGEENFVDPAKDVPVFERCVSPFMARCSKAAEGYFFGAEYLGMNDCFLAPTSYEAVSCSTADLRYPSSLTAGHHVVHQATGQQYTLLLFLLHVEPGQVRYYAALGDERALIPSAKQTDRYFIVPLCKKREAVISITSLATKCGGANLNRLQSGLVEFMSTVTPNQVKNSDFHPPAAVEDDEVGADATDTAAAAAVSTDVAEAAAVSTDAASTGGAATAEGPETHGGHRKSTRQKVPRAPPAAPAPAPERLPPKKLAPPFPSESKVVLPSQFPYSMKGIAGGKKFKSGLRKGLPPPTLSEVKKLCAHHQLSTDGSKDALIASLLRNKRKKAAVGSDEDSASELDAEPRPDKKPAAKVLPLSKKCGKGAIVSKETQLLVDQQADVEAQLKLEVELEEKRILLKKRVAERRQRELEEAEEEARHQEEMDRLSQRAHKSAKDKGKALSTSTESRQHRSDRDHTPNSRPERSRGKESSVRRDRDGRHDEYGKDYDSGDVRDRNRSHHYRAHHRSHDDGDTPPHLQRVEARLQMLEDQQEREMSRLRFESARFRRKHT